MRMRTLLVLLPLVAGTARAQDSGGTLVPLPSVAEPDGAASLLHNPGGIAALQAWELRLYNTQMEGAGEGTAVLFGIPVLGPLSLGTAFEHLRPPGDAANRVRFSLAAGLRLHDTFRIGLAWRHLFADLEAADGLDALDIGLLLRLAEWVSIGVTISDVNTPVVGESVIPRVYGLGFAFRPGTDRVSLEVGASIREDDGQVDTVGRVRFEPIPGWEILARVAVQPREDQIGLEIGTAMAFHFGPAGVEGGAFLRQPAGGDVAYDGFSVGVRLSGAHYRPLYHRTGKTVLIELSTVPEEPKPGLSGGGYSFTHLLSYLDDLARDDTVSGVLLRDKGSAYGWAQVQELREAILALKKAGKRVTAYLDQGDLGHTYLYSAADKVVLSPAGGLMVTGMRSTITFYREALEKLHVRTQWVKYGKYKTYPEAFQRTSPSEWSIEARNSMLDTIYGTVVGGIAEGRSLEPDRVRAIVDEGPFVAAEAKAAGLVDHLAFYDEVTEWMQKDLGVPIRLVKASSGPRMAREPWARRPAIAVVAMQGSIVEGQSGRVPILGVQNIGSTTIVEAVQAAAADPRVEGIVLRIDSPGGSSFASDLMHRAIAKAAEKKPIVASFGNTAASGGYYLAMGAKEVYSSDLTVTGSIGIFTGKPAFGELLGLLGIGRSTLTRGKRADIFGTDKPWTDDEVKLMEQKLKTFYDLFLARVAESRKMEVAKVDELAQGRIWLGSQAKEHRLVDNTGGVVPAIRRAKELAGLHASEEVDLVFLPQPDLLERVRNALGIEVEQLLALFGGLRDTLAVAYPFLNGFRPGEPLALMPFVLEIE